MPNAEMHVPTMINKRFIALILLLTAILLASCIESVPNVDDVGNDTKSYIKEEQSIAETTGGSEKIPSFAERLEGIYRRYDEENGETVCQVYYIGGMLIAEVKEQYAAYYACELIEESTENAKEMADRANFTVKTFSGFSYDGEYWPETADVSITLNDEGFEYIANGNEAVRYIRDESIRPIHDPTQYTGVLSETSDGNFPEEIVGLWKAESDDAKLSARFFENGTSVLCIKYRGEPISVYIGAGAADLQSKTINIMSERVGWSNMPEVFGLEYSFMPNGNLLLKNSGGYKLFSTDEAVEFKK